MELVERIRGRTARLAVLGLGEVGATVARAFAGAGFATAGYDVDAEAAARFARATGIPAGADEAAIGGRDVYVLAPPTPLDAQGRPDQSAVAEAGKTVARIMGARALVVLESTVQPGATRTILKPALGGRDVLLAYSPERIDSGNAAFPFAKIPKLVSGETPEARAAAAALYATVVERVVEVESLEIAEAAKLYENVFRAVNVALANELKLGFDAMGIDIWKVIEAAKTKPFGFMAFEPGPGLGGHCMPVNPAYLADTLRKAAAPSQMVELSSEINAAMPDRVIERLERALRQTGKDLRGARVLVLGIAFKKNVANTRGSPGLRLMELLIGKGATALYSDPYVPRMGSRASTPITRDTLKGMDAVIIATDHDNVDYRALAASAPLIVDCRNAFAKRGIRGDNIVKA